VAAAFIGAGLAIVLNAWFYSKLVSTERLLVRANELVERLAAEVDGLGHDWENQGQLNDLISDIEKKLDQSTNILLSAKKRIKYNQWTDEFSYIFVVLWSGVC
jgi:hypothetical protein